MSDGRRKSAAFAAIDIILAVEDEGWLRALPQDPEPLVRRAVEAAATRCALPHDLATELGVTLTDDQAVRALNAEWREKDKPTNILSFPTRAIAPGERPGPLIGDLVLARQTCLAEADAEGKTVADHFTHLVVHGFLHLLGHDHLDDDEAEAMERLEVEILSDLSIGDPYALAGELQAAGNDAR
jgi:probable rRNA maturation factor